MKKRQFLWQTATHALPYIGEKKDHLGSLGHPTSFLYNMSDKTEKDGESKRRRPLWKTETPYKSAISENMEMEKEKWRKSDYGKQRPPTNLP